MSTVEPVHLVTEASDVTQAEVKVVTRSITHFPTRGSYTANNNSVAFGWHGVQDMAGIKECQVKDQIKIVIQ